MTQQKLYEHLNEVCVRLFGCDLSVATEKQAYKVLCTELREILAKKRKDFTDKTDGKKEVYYMSMEFLVGTSLRNNLFNLGVEKQYRELMQSLGFDMDSIYALDPDAGLGNGGLGRLASCYMDSMTGLGMPATGFSAFRSTASRYFP